MGPSRSMLSYACALAAAGCVSIRPIATPRRDIEGTHLEMAAGLALDDPPGVNQPPLCKEMALPCSARTFPDFGLVIQGAIRHDAHLAFVTEGSIYVDTWDTVGVNNFGEHRSNHVAALLAGARWMSGSFVTSDGIVNRFFTQVLAGPEISTYAPTRFALQPGAGADFKLAGAGWWFRPSFDYRWTHGDPWNVSGGRFTAALVFVPSQHAQPASPGSRRF